MFKDLVLFLGTICNNPLFLLLGSREAITSLAEKHDLAVNEDETVWEPLRAYQSKLEKLSQKTIAEQAARTKRVEDAAVAAAVTAVAGKEGEQEGEQQAQSSQDHDVDMEKLSAVDVHDNRTAIAKSVSGISKKRTVTDKDDEDDVADEEEEEEEESESEKLIRRRKRSTPTDEEDDPESDTESQTKEIKRIRVD